MASSTRSASSSNSVPGTRVTCIRPASRRISTLTAWSARHAALVVAEEPLGRSRIDALAAFFMGRRGPGRRWAIAARLSTCRIGRPLQQLELVHRAGALTVDGAQAVRAGVAAADDHDPLSLRGDDVCRRDVVAGQPPVLLRQVLDGEVHAAELATPEIWRSRAHGVPRPEHDRIELPAQAGDRNRCRSRRWSGTRRLRPT